MIISHLPDLTSTAVPVEEAPPSGDLVCHCYACCHPASDNAGERTLHRERHFNFVLWMAQRPIPVPKVRRIAWRPR